MRGGSLRRYYPDNLQTGQGVGQLIVNDVGDVLKGAIGNTIKSLGGEKVIRQAAKTFKKSVRRGTKRKAATFLARAAKRKTRDIFGLA